MNLSRLLVESISDNSLSQKQLAYIQSLNEKLTELPDNDYLKFLYEHIDDADVSSIICVQIPSYKDVDVINTVNSLFINAVNPERIRVKIFYQDDDMDLLKQLQTISNVEVEHIPSFEAQGLCYARYRCNQMVESDTDFVMHIDSHMRFAKFWDVALILSWQLCDDDKAIVSQRPFDFSAFYAEPLDSDRFIKEARHFYMKLVYYQYSEDYCNNILPKPLTVYPDSSVMSKQSACISGGLVFGRAEIDILVPSDPSMHFVADENSMALRYWTHGFNIYSPDYYFVYHLYNRPAVIGQHLNLSVDLGYNSASIEKRTLEWDRLKSLFNIPCDNDIDLGEFGLGSVRSLEDYQLFCGVNFADRIIYDYSVNGDCNISLSADVDKHIVWRDWSDHDMHIGIYYIATGKYKDLFADFVKSLEYFYPNVKKTLVVISDGLKEWDGYAVHNLYVKMGTTVNHYPWPVLTLYKMYLIRENYDTSFTHMCYFNANALVQSGFDESVLNPNKFNVTLHSFGSGYDVFSHVSISKESKAYLKNYTYDYIQACFFFGPSWLMLKMCDAVVGMLDNDMAHHLFAQWHDESYLNKWCQNVNLRDFMNRKQFCLFETLPITDEHTFILMRDKRRFSIKK